MVRENRQFQIIVEDAFDRAEDGRGEDAFGGAEDSRDEDVLGIGNASLNAKIRIVSINGLLI